MEGGLCIWNLPALLFPWLGIFVLAAFTWAFLQQIFFPLLSPTPPPRQLASQRTERGLFSRSRKNPSLCRSPPAPEPPAVSSLEGCGEQPRTEWPRQGLGSECQEGGRGEGRVSRGQRRETSARLAPGSPRDLLEEIRDRMERVPKPGGEKKGDPEPSRGGALGRGGPALESLITC